jgi:hypothetical protein
MLLSAVVFAGETQKLEQKRPAACIHGVVAQFRD